MFSMSSSMTLAYATELRHRFSFPQRASHQRTGAALCLLIAFKLSGLQGSLQALAFSGRESSIAPRADSHVPHLKIRTSWSQKGLKAGPSKRLQLEINLNTGCIGGIVVALLWHFRCSVQVSFGRSSLQAPFKLCDEVLMQLLPVLRKSQKQITLRRHLKTSEDSQDVTAWRVQTWITWLLLDQRCSMLNDGPADALHPRCPSSTWRPADADSNAKFFMRFTQFRHVLSVGFSSSASILAWKKSAYCSAKAKASSAKPSWQVRSAQSVQSAQPDAGLKQTTVRTQRTAVLCPEPVFQLLQQGWCINSVNPKLNLLTNCLQRKMFQSPSERKCFAKTRPCDSNLVSRILILIIDIVSKNPTVLSLSKVSPLGNQTWLGWSVQWLKPSSATGHAPGIHSASPWLKNKARVHQEGNFSTNNVRDLCWGVLWQQKMSKWAVWNDPFVVFVCHQLITDKYTIIYIYSSLHEWSRWHRYV